MGRLSDWIKEHVVDDDPEPEPFHGDRFPKRPKNEDPRNRPQKEGNQ